jgi:hypothetical protein
MRNIEKLKNKMQPGRVYRRRDLQSFTTAIDRDLKTLVRKGEIKKLTSGIYYRPRKNPFGVTPPNDYELVRAFLKTEDFLLFSYNLFNQLGLGLTQVYNNCVIYNHKRTGRFTLGGKQFIFRIIPAYPTKVSKEYLLIDLLNNLKHLPDDTSSVLKNLSARLKDFDQDKLKRCLNLYGNHAAQKALMKIHG